MKITATVELPDAALHYHLVAYGKTRSGKTYAIKGIVEKLMDAGRRVCIVDPTGAYWGLKHKGEGPHAKGYPFTVFGGKHADVAINDRAASPLAALLMGSPVPAIIDTQQMSVAERTRFFTKFAEEVFRLSDPARPIHLVIDEAHLFAPKSLPARNNTGDDDKANPMMMLHNTIALATGGGSQGIRLMVASQRPAKLHNDVASQCETMIAMRVLHPTDREAVEDWVKGAGDAAKAKEILNSLAGLRRGEGWLWYPEGNVLSRVMFPTIRSYDSSRTPDDGEAAAPLTPAAAIDLSGIKASLAEAVKESEANDPKRLKARIAELEGQLRAKPAAVTDHAAAARATARADQLSGEVRDLKARNAQLDEAIAQVETRHRSISGLLQGQGEIIAQAKAVKWAAAPNSNDIEVRDLAGNVTMTIPVRGAEGVTIHKPSDPIPQLDPVPVAPGDNELPKMHRAFLTVLAQRGAMTKGRLLLHAGYASSGPVSKAFARLGELGYVTSDNGTVDIARAGREALGRVEPLPSGEHLRRRTLSELSTMEAALLRAFFGAWPDGVTKGKVLGVAGYASSGPVSKAFAKLTGRGFIVKASKGQYKASEEFFS